MRQDSWQPVVLAQLTIRSPAKHGFHLEDHLEPEEGEEGYLEDGAQHPVSRSYEWLLAVLTHLSGE